MLKRVARYGVRATPACEKMYLTFGVRAKVFAVVKLGDRARSCRR